MRGEATVRLRTVPDPEPAEGEVLVQLAAAGICGSDLHAYLGHDPRRPPPLILGHEAAGTVLSGPEAGRRVTLNPLVTCQSCPACKRGQTNLCGSRQILSMEPRPGAFAEQVAVPERNLVTVPDAVTFEAAALTEPLACGWHGVRLAREACPVALEKAACLVFGGGAIGFGAGLVLRALGVRQIALVEPNAARRATLSQHCDLTLLSLEDLENLPDNSQQLLIDGVGQAATRTAAVAKAQPGAVLVHIGLGSSDGRLDIRKITLQEIRLIGSYTYSEADFRATAAALFEGALGDLSWAELRALDQGAQAFADLEAQRVAAPKIILQP